jgi:hypothetical protein
LATRDANGAGSDAKAGGFEAGEAGDGFGQIAEEGEAGAEADGEAAIVFARMDRDKFLGSESKRLGREREIFAELIANRDHMAAALSGLGHGKRIKASIIKGLGIDVKSDGFVGSDRFDEAGRSEFIERFGDSIRLDGKIAEDERLVAEGFDNHFAKSREARK